MTSRWSRCRVTSIPDEQARYAPWQPFFWAPSPWGVTTTGQRAELVGKQTCNRSMEQ